MNRQWHQRSSVRALFTTAFILLLVLGYPVLRALLSQDATPPAQGGTPAMQRMPWDLNKSVDGETTSVFGLSLGVSSLGDAYQILGTDLQVAFLTPPNKPPVLEAYLDPLRTGPLTGKLILSTEITPLQVSRWIENSKKRQISETGAKIHTPADSDLPQVLRNIITSIHYLPAADLDEATILSRFGPPESRTQVESDLVLLRYPQVGLLITVNGHGKEVFQYVHPAQFNRYFPG
jgi:hypothetical protein